MNSDFSFPALESHGGTLTPFNDGHSPETFVTRGTDESTDSARIVRYNDHHASASNSVGNDVHVYNEVINPHHVQMLYEVTSPSKQHNKDMDDSTLSSPSLDLTGESPWGTYVAVEEALDWINWTTINNDNCRIDTTTYEDYLASWRANVIDFHKWQGQQKLISLSDEKKEDESYQSTRRRNNLDQAKSHLESMDLIRHALAVEAVAKFFIDKIPSSSGDFVASSQQNQSTNKELYTKTNFLKQAHGVAVWSLSSRPGASVQYHIDYAELLRYEYNVTVPPLWAGTIQCSALCNNNQITNATENAKKTKRMVGGEFCVNLNGLEHYAEHGYKGMISGDPMGGWKSPDTAIGGVHLDSSNKWVTIPYTCNRGIVHNGDLPHLSSPIQHIDDDDLSRVIVGFNVFGHDVGTRVAKAPEHSRQFRRQVKLYRTTLSTPKGNDGRRNGGIDLSQIRKNKGLTKLLVLAKRERVKAQLRRDQEQLTRNIWSHLLSHYASDEKRPFLCVGDIVDRFGIPSTESGWPTPVDAHVHLHNMIKQHDGTDGSKYRDVDGIGGMCGASYKIILLDDLASSTQGNLIDTSTAMSVMRCESDTDTS